MKERKALGKGFASLIPEVAMSRDDISDKIVFCELEKIITNPKQPRKKFESEALKELSDSIKEKGVLQPLLVKRAGDKYQIIAGGRRFEAAKMAGLSEVPVLVKDIQKSEDLELALIENIQREDLNPMEEAAGYKMLLDEFGFSHEDIAKKVGKSRTTITNSLRLLKLPQLIQNALMENKITMGHARTILAMEGEEEQITFLNQIIKGNLSVRKAESIVQESTRHGKSFKLDSKAANPFLRSIIEELQRTLGTRVKILQKKDSSGKLIIDFFSTQDLNRILAFFRK
jgi:ParB family transcriptional regulator, chromosome partitioning protein